MPNRITLTVRDNSFTDNYFTTERVDSVSAYNYNYRNNIEDTLKVFCTKCNPSKKW